MNLNNLAKEICKREGKKVQVNIAQVKEILRVLIDIMTEGPVPQAVLSMAVIQNKIYQSAEYEILMKKKTAKKK